MVKPTDLTPEEKAEVRAQRQAHIQQNFPDETTVATDDPNSMTRTAVHQALMQLFRDGLEASSDATLRQMLLGAREHRAETGRNPFDFEGFNGAVSSRALNAGYDDGDPDGVRPAIWSGADDGEAEPNLDFATNAQLRAALDEREMAGNVADDFRVATRGGEDVKLLINPSMLSVAEKLALEGENVRQGDVVAAEPVSPFSGENPTAPVDPRHEEIVEHSEEEAARVEGEVRSPDSEAPPPPADGAQVVEPAPQGAEAAVDGVAADPALDAATKERQEEDTLEHAQEVAGGELANDGTGEALPPVQDGEQTAPGATEDRDVQESVDPEQMTVKQLHEAIAKAGGTVAKSQTDKAVLRDALAKARSEQTQAAPAAEDAVEF